MIRDQGYKILHVGENNNYKSTYLLDNTGDNISNKNQNYCELTGLYWIWKNQSSDQIAGIVHYRRFFCTEHSWIQYTYLHYPLKPISSEKCRIILDNYDIILPKKKSIHMTSRKFYEDSHDINDLLLTRRIIQDFTPDYIKAFDNVMKESHIYYANMMVSKKSIFDQYCEWLFPILFELEKNIDLSKYTDSYQRRVFGFISERLLQVWVEKNKFKVFQLPIVNSDEPRQTIWLRTKNHINNVSRKILSKKHNENKEKKA